MSEEAQQPQSQPSAHKPRINLQELRNCDLVSRFLAATPPYLYAAPTGPNNFFFSEMLRSLVQARTNEHAANRKQPTNNIPATVSATAAIPPTRRNRKRMWTQQRVYDINANEYKEMPMSSDTNKSLPPEKPLELTNKMLPHTYPSMAKYQKSESPRMLPPDNAVLQQKPIRIEHSNPPQSDIKPHINTATFPMGNDTHSNQSHLEPSPASAANEMPSSDLVLPPPPPMWYPPLYPPYGIDPLHFFIDLRVSGHIYDRKKENISPSNISHTTSSSVQENNNQLPLPPTLLDPATDSIGKHRHGSAFSVPPPRRDNNNKSPSSALNLTFSQPEKLNEFNNNNNNHQQYYERMQAELKDSKNNTQYVMQNLPKIYTNLMPHGGDGGGGGAVDGRNSVNSAEESDSKSESDAQDIDVKDNQMLLMRNRQSPCNSVGGGDDQDDSNDVVIVDNKSN